MASQKKISFLHTHERGEIMSQKGFTLIEIIASLVITGILAAVVGMAIVQAVKGYMTVKDNSTATQEAQLAMSRINREIIELTRVTSSASNTTLPIMNVSQVDAGGSIIGQRTIGFDSASNAVKVAFNSTDVANGDIIINNVSSLTFTYYKGSTAYTSWSPSTMKDTDLSAIDVSLSLIKPNMTFTTRITPRNNGNMGGADLPSVTPPVGPRYGCFVATAAYGDRWHPMVQILRDFRDSYLISFPAGQWFIKQYNKYGPAAAHMIRNRQLAMWAVRCLLAPIIALIFCLMYAPLAIPSIFFVSLIITSALFSTLRRRSSPSYGVFNSRGSILIGLIFTMVMMAALTAAMLPMFSSSYLNQAYADQSRRAYYLAEAGFAYASSEYLNALDANKNAKLAEINGKTCNLLDDAGKFTITVTPLWSVAGTYASGNLPTTVYGGIPAELNTGTGGYIKVGSNYYSYSSRSGTGSTVTFSGISPTSPVPTAAADVLSVALPSSTTTVTQGGNLTLSTTSPGGSDAFPLLNGNFKLNGTGTAYNYERRVGNVLQKITLSNKSGTWVNFTVTSGAITATAATKIVLDKFARVSSTGNTGNTTRTIVYNVPIGLTGTGGMQKRQDDDLPNDIANWSKLSGSSSFGGTHEISTVDGGSALHVKTATTVGWWTTNQWAVAIFNGYLNSNLAQSWLDAGGFLSYDVQAKVYNTQPYYLAGINLRTRNNASATDLYTYGVSFVRARQYGSCFFYGCSWYNTYWGNDQDDIDNDIVPSNLFSGTMEQRKGAWRTTYYRYSQPAIVLWKRNSSGAKWLAYRTLTAADGILTGSSPNFRLSPWAELLVRVAEGYSLTFTSGNQTTPIKEGDTVTSSGASDWSARVVMTPILSSTCSWTSGSPCSGTLVLANITGTFVAGDLRVSGVRLATTGTYTATKKNYIKVYYASTAVLGTANSVETDNNRLANPRGTVNWPPDDVADVASSTDYMSLVTWSNTNTDTKTSFLTASGSSAKVVVDWDLTTPALDSTPSVSEFSGDAPAVVTSSDNATYTYYDDFAIQMDESYGTGFLQPIQQ